MTEGVWCNLVVCTMCTWACWLEVSLNGQVTDMSYRQISDLVNYRINRSNGIGCVSLRRRSHLDAINPFDVKDVNNRLQMLTMTSIGLNPIAWQAESIAAIIVRCAYPPKVVQTFYWMKGSTMQARDRNRIYVCVWGIYHWVRECIFEWVIISIQQLANFLRRRSFSK